jgi:non-ribosomal peptide synthetase component F
LIVAFLAVLKAGGIYVPIDPEYPAERIRLLLTDSTAPVVVRFGLVPLLTEQPATVVDLRRDAAEIARQPSTVPPVATSAESGAALFYTSGSTGGPKGVCIPHRAMVRLVRDTNYAEFAATDVFLQLAPVSFDAATLEMILTTGEVINMDIELCRGSAARPMTQEDLVIKFRSQCHQTMTVAETDQLLDSCQQLESLADVSLITHAAAGVALN